ncbi:hypothetical protein NPIL_468411 [Nephila pilipes]|uniref:BTB domain-containing protein n=1 Tax=Nephila pilipes TaxID=299642 RepID=A0A8X6MB06_NEPPI|nr:hypothetical protein NPIL_468411 [Nephila pilipes]
MICPNHSMLITEVFYSSVDQKFSNNLLFLLKSGLFYDAILCAGSEGFSREFKVHQAILHVRAPLLLKAVTMDLIQNVNKIKIPFVSANAMEEILYYVYSGQARTTLSNINIYESAACLFGLLNLQRQLSWRDFLTAITEYEYYSYSFQWELEAFFEEQNKLETFSLNKRFNGNNEIGTIAISCTSRSERNEVWLIFESRFDSFSSTIKIILLSCTCKLLYNDDFKRKRTDHPLEFEHTFFPSVTRNENVLFSRSYLLNRKRGLVFPRNTLKIMFDLRVGTKLKHYKIYHVNNKQLELSECHSCHQLNNDVSQLYLCPTYSDVTFMCRNGMTFPAHKAILAARHQPFQKMLEENEGVSIFRTTESEKRVRKFFKFLYSGKISVLIDN